MISNMEYELPPNMGHSLLKKTFHKPTYCHNCTEMLWGIMQQGYICEVCNYITHDRCLKNLVTPCTVVAATLIRNPVAHCWTSSIPIKRKFCNVCRKKWDNRNHSEFYCELCEYYSHSECMEYALPNCKEMDLYVPGKSLSSLSYEHHWREGNLPSTARCQACHKHCSSAVCLAGFRCEVCGISCHAACMKVVPKECTFGELATIFLPPRAVSVPRTGVPIEAIMGVKELEWKEPSPLTMSSMAELTTSSTDMTSNCELEEPSSKDKRERLDHDEELIHVYDGNSSIRRGLHRSVVVSRLATVDHLLKVSLQLFHVVKNQEVYCLSDVHSYSDEETILEQGFPVAGLTRLEGKVPSVCLRIKDDENSTSVVRIFAGKLQTSRLFCSIPVNDETTVADLITKSLNELRIENTNISNYRLTEVMLDKGVSERILDNDEKPWKIMKMLAHESINRMQLMRFYLQMKLDPHGTKIALFVSNMPKGKSDREYENYLIEKVGKENSFLNIGPIYYDSGSLVVTFTDVKKAVDAFNILNETKNEDGGTLLVSLLPNIEPSMIPPTSKPLLVFVNLQSGGCQGPELISKFRKALNPYQVFNLNNGGPLPGLHVFRHIKDYRILVCGGDGTVGWVLQALDNVGQDSECSSPPCGIVPLGTGNDLSRVLKWGPGYNSTIPVRTLLKEVIEAEEIKLDRWGVMLNHEEHADTPTSEPGTPGTDDKSAKTQEIMVMNNYFGIGLDADLCLQFHNARKENPQKFQSRLGNKQMYFCMGLRKMTTGSPTCYAHLQRNVTLEVDGNIVQLPDIEGIIILNILSWGSGANPWGNETGDPRFTYPNHYDGKLEVVGVNGVMHLGQIQSGFRTGIKIAQGSDIKIHLNIKIPIQIDGEPQKFGPGVICILRSALKATMLKKEKKAEPTSLNGEKVESEIVPEKV